jgi:hypothetical protein
MFGNGPWKEGRQVAVSLCYVAPTPAQLEFVAANHARVGIRATVVNGPAGELLQTLAGRNWDLTTAEPAGMVSAEAAGLRERVEKACTGNDWTIWRLDGAVLTALGAEAHGALLNWLGQEHARVWCAPVRDIQKFGKHI